MVQYAVIGCSNRSDNQKKSGRDKVSFFSFPTIVRDKMLNITTEQHCAWLKAIFRDDLVGTKLENLVVCEKHFKKGIMLL